MAKQVGIFRRLKWVVLIALIGVLVAVFLNRQWIYDFWRGKTYNPSSEMVRIREDLGLTDHGEFLFNAAWPELNSSAEFNAYCRDGDDEVAVLGCYTSGDIHVYDITEEELDGLRELTTAHELLHVVWARMDDEERRSLTTALTQTFDANKELLESELDAYDTSEKQEELYVRAGTEIKNLPDSLEKHYAKIFKDQDKVVDFYEKYIKVFRELEAELDTLESEIKILGEEIEQKTQDYEQRSEQLNADIVSFNSCAEVEGCFSGQGEFYAKRWALVNEQNVLEGLYNEINELIDGYNSKVELYNADVLRGEDLQKVINSSAKPSEL